MLHSRLDSYNTLRQAYPEFVYESFFYWLEDDRFYVKFRFGVSGKIMFEPKLVFHTGRLSQLHALSREELDLFCFNLGMAELVSYWKATCSPELIIKAAILDDWQITWWKKLYYKGLGEFFHTNGIQPEYNSFLDISCISKNRLVKADKPLADEILLPVGGGKDSIVSLEILLESGLSVTPYVINFSKTHQKVLETAGFEAEDVIRIDRVIDPVLLDLNDRGFLNGHTPFSAVVAFTSVFAAYASGKRYILLSNESSANEPTIPETGVNHQYSKSIEFESDFRNYVQRNLHPEIDYFSLLRPLNELQIARIFSRFNKYHEVFRSCNKGSKEGIWCGNCPKCLFTQIILSPFISPDTLQRIFSKNLLEDASLETTFRQLTGLDDEKPFECVGTLGEVNAAIRETMKIHKKYRPYLLNYYGNLMDRISSGQTYVELMNSHDPDNFLPPEFDKMLMKWL